MVLLPAKITAARWNHDKMVEYSGESESLSGYFFGFSEYEHESLESSSHGYEDLEEKKALWVSQQQLLHVMSILSTYQYLFFFLFPFFLNFDGL